MLVSRPRIDGIARRREICPPSVEVNLSVQICCHFWLSSRVILKEAIAARVWFDQECVFLGENAAAKE